MARTVSLEIRTPTEPTTHENIPLDEKVWEVWKAKGRKADIAIDRKMKTLAAIGVVLAAVGLAVFLL